jgi:hypothetical protein
MDSKDPPDIRRTCRTSGMMASRPGHNASCENTGSEARAFRRESRNAVALGVFRRA